MNSKPCHQTLSWPQSRGFVVVVMLVVIAVFFVIREHWEHLAGVWVYLLLLLCPLMHFFGHGGHRSHAEREQKGDGNEHET